MLFIGLLCCCCCYRINTNYIHLIMLYHSRITNICGSNTEEAPSTNKHDNGEVLCSLAHLYFFIRFCSFLDHLNKWRWLPILNVHDKELNLCAFRGNSVKCALPESCYQYFAFRLSVFCFELPSLVSFRFHLCFDKIILATSTICISGSNIRHQHAVFFWIVAIKTVHSTETTKTHVGMNAHHSTDPYL